MQRQESILDANDPTQHAEEAQERWGDTDAYRQSQQRTKRYGKADWELIRQDAATLNENFIELMRSGVSDPHPRQR